MNILLLGGSGFIGREILNELSCNKEFYIMAIENTNPVKAIEGIKVIHQNLNSLNLSKLPVLPDVIIHTARYRTGRFGKIGRKWVASKGRRANRKILNQIKRLPNKPRLIYLSGSLMYGSRPEYLIHENFPLSPVSFAKEYVIAEEVFLQEVERNNPDVLMVRVPWVIGPGSWFEWNYLNFIRKNNCVPLYGKGENVMTFLDVRDLARNIVQLCQIEHQGILNLFNQEYMTQKEFAGKLACLLQKEIKFLELENNPDLSPAVKEAFVSEIQLGSNYKELQALLQANMIPVEESIRHYCEINDGSKTEIQPELMLSQK